MNKLFKVSVLIALTALIAALFLVKKANRSERTKEKITGALEIISDSKYLVKDETAVVTVLADSQKTAILGYDLELEFNSDFLNLAAVDNLLKSQFDIYATDKNRRLLITGIKKPNYQDTVVFAKTPVISVHFKVLKSGKTKIDIGWVKNSKKESNLISVNNVDILNRADGLLIFGGEAVRLTKDKVYRYGDLSLLLVKAAPADPDCRDCLTEVQLRITKTGDKEKELNFRIGGFAGEMVDKLAAFGRLFVIKNVYDGAADMVIYEN